MKKLMLYFLFGLSMACSNPEPQTAIVIHLEEMTQLMNAQPHKLQVINFWATWCKPCVEELPAFEKIQKEYGDQVEVILISLDDVEKVESQVNPFLANNSIQSQVKLLDYPYAAEYIPLVDSHWDGAIPVTLIKYRDKSKFFNKEFTYEELEEEVQNLLK